MRVLRSGRDALSQDPTSFLGSSLWQGKVRPVVVGGGGGLRGGGDLPKQSGHVLGEPVIRSSLALFAGHDAIAFVQPVIHADDAARFQAASAGLDLLPPVDGGALRQASV